MSFKDLKKRSNTSIEKLNAEMEKLNKGGESYKDDRFWRPSQDQAGNGYAVIRFLPPSDGEDLPWCRLFSHAFKGPGGWYIENSRTTLGDKDPVSEMNTRLWNSGLESDKDIARDRKRKLNYISNIYVVSDPSNPENEGKVFLYKYGKKIFDKINEAMNPEFEDENAVNPFDFWAGANFRLKIRKVAGYTNYDKSEFEQPSALHEDDEVLEKIYNSQHKLNEFTDASNFKSYEELKEKLDKVLTGTEYASKAENTRLDDEYEERTSPSMPEKAASSAPTIEPEEEDDAMSYFERLANEG
jgi:hypothetical protein